MLEAVTKLTVQTSEMGASKKPLELWTDDELEEELDKRLEGIAANYQVIEAQSSEPDLLGLTDHGITETSVDGPPSGDISEVLRGDQDVRGDLDSGGDAQVQGE